MKNKDIAKLLREVAASYLIQDQKKYYFQIIAYQRAADTIENSASEIKDLYKEEKLDTLPGVGSIIQAYLKELLETGTVKRFEEIKEKIPQEVFPLLKISGIGPKTAIKLVTHLGIKGKDPVGQLIKMAGKHEVSKLDGFGDKKEAGILNAIREYQKGVSKENRMLLPFAYELAQKVIDHMKKCADVIQIEPLGSLRRCLSTVGDIDLAVASKNPASVIEWFKKYPYQERIIEAGRTSASLLTSGAYHVDIIVQKPDGFGALLQHFTGSKPHNIHLRNIAQSLGLSLSEKGIKKTYNTSKIKLNYTNYNNKEKIYEYKKETDFYNALGMEWIPPEIREDNGEIEAALKKKLPRLVEVGDIKGDLHLHSSYNIEPSHDLGSDSIKEILLKAQKMSYEYIGFSEHNPSQSKHSSRDYLKLLKDRNAIIDDESYSTKSVRVFKLLEVDILSDGDLAIDNDSLKILDAVIVSIHSSFNQSRDKMTARILKALSCPKAKILGHPTGRLINTRQGYDADWAKIFAHCKENHKALEINSSPTRLDLPDFLIREAVKNGVKMIVNTDSHALSQMDLLKFGVALARRGWAQKTDILNTLCFSEFKKWLSL